MSEKLLVVGLSNAIVVTGLAVAVLVLTRILRHAPLAHLLWLVVLVKLVGTPLEMHARAALAAAYGQEADQDWKEWLRTCGLPQGT